MVISVRPVRRGVARENVGPGPPGRRTVGSSRRFDYSGPMPDPLDAIDQRLLTLLQAEARLPVAELGRRVGLSRTATLARMRRLEEQGVIRGYHADVALPGARSTHAARVGIVLRGGDPAALLRRLRELPELEEAESVAGEYDLIVRLAAADAARLDEILDRINGWPQTVRTTTFVVLKRYIAS